MRRYSILGSLVGVICLVSGAAFGADVELPDELLLFGNDVLVSTATKHLQKLSEVPGSVMIVTEKEIREKGSLSLRELLLNACGLSFSNEGLFPTLRVRGLQASYNNKVLVLLDGRKLNTLDWGNHPLDYSLPLSNIKQIEIIQGPGSALYGANAYAGVINIISKTGAELNGLHTRVSLGQTKGGVELDQLAQVGTGQKQIGQMYGLSYGEKKGAWDYSVNTDYWRAFGLDAINLDQPNITYYGQRAHVSLAYADTWSLRTGYEAFSEPWIGSVYTPTPVNQAQSDLWFVDSKYRWTLGELSEATLRLEDTYYRDRTVMSSAFDLQRHAITSAGDVPPGTTVIVTDQGAILPASQALGGYYIDVEGFARLTGGAASQRIPKGDGPMNELLVEGQYDLKWPEANYLLAGASFTHDWARLNYFAETVESDQNYAVYVQDEYRPWDEMILLAGGRYDYNTDYKGNFSPRASLIYEVSDDLRAKLAYGSAFRAPVFLERFTQTSYGFYDATGKPDLRPEEIQQGEASLNYRFEKWLDATARCFYWQTRNEIQFKYTYAPLYVYSPNLQLIDPSLPAMPGLFYAQALNENPSQVSWSNANSRIGRGAELEVHVQPLSFMRLDVNYSHVNLYSVNVPEHPSWAEGDADSLNGMLGFNHLGFFLNLYAHADRVPVQVLSGAQSTSEGAPYNVRLAWLKQVDASLGYNTESFNLTVVALNLFEHARDFDTLRDDYLKSQRIYRLNAEYIIRF